MTKCYHFSSSNSSYNDNDDHSNRSSSSNEPSPPSARKNDHNTSVKSPAKATPTNKTRIASLGKSGRSSANRPAASSGKKLNTPINTKKTLLKKTPISAMPDTPVSSAKAPQKYPISAMPDTPVSSAKAPQKSLKSSTENLTKNKLNLFEESNFETPVKDNDIEIDEGMEAMLNTLYGEEWKTPSLLQSCKSRKFQKAVRKSMALSNFGACEYFEHCI